MKMNLTTLLIIITAAFIIAGMLFPVLVGSKGTMSMTQTEYDRQIHLAYNHGQSDAFLSGFTHGKVAGEICAYKELHLVAHDNNPWATQQLVNAQRARQKLCTEQFEDEQRQWAKETGDTSLANSI